MRKQKLFLKVFKNTLRSEDVLHWKKSGQLETDDYLGV